MRLIVLQLIAMGVTLMTGSTTSADTSADAHTAPTDRVLMIVREDSRDQDLMLEQEALLMKGMIEDAGYDVEVATVHDAPLTGRVNLTPDLKLGEINFDRYDGLILPCMAAEPQKTMPEVILGIIERAHARDLPIGAMRGSVRELARAGVLDGHHYSYAAQVDVDEHPELSRATFDGTGITRDRKIATAGVCPLAAKVLGEPDGTTALTQAFLEILKAERSTAVQ